MYGRLGRLVCLFLYWLGFAGLAHSAVYDAYAVETGAIANGRADISYVVRETASMGVKSYKRSDLLYPAARSKDLILSGAKLAKNNAISIALMAAVSGAGWAIDELTGQVTGSSSGDSDGYVPGKYYMVKYCEGNCYGRTPLEAVQNNADSLSEKNPSLHVTVLNATSTSAQYCYNFGSGDCPVRGWSVHQYDCGSSLADFCTSGAPSSPVSDSDVMQLFKDVLSGANLVDLFTDANGNPLITPELIAELEAMADPASNPENSVDTDPKDGVEHLDFCKQAINAGNPLCDDSPAPEVQEMPTTTVSVVDWDSGLGSGSCPAPRNSSLQGQQVGYDYTVACGAISDYVRPILLLGAFMLSAFILVGVKA